MGKPELPDQQPKDMKEASVDPQTEGKRIIESAMKATEQSKLSTAEREAMENLASDFPEFVFQDAENPGRFVINVPLVYKSNFQQLMTIRGPVAPSTYVVSGNMAKALNSVEPSFGDEPPIKGDISLYILSGALQICKEVIRAQKEYSKKLGDKNAEKKYHEAMKAYGAEFGKWMKNPTRTLREKVSTATEKEKKFEGLTEEQKTVLKANGVANIRPDKSPQGDASTALRFSSDAEIAVKQADGSWKSILNTGVIHITHFDTASVEVVKESDAATVILHNKNGSTDILRTRLTKASN